MVNARYVIADHQLHATRMYVLLLLSLASLHAGLYLHMLDACSAHSYIWWDAMMECCLRNECVYLWDKSNIVIVPLMLMMMIYKSDAFVNHMARMLPIS